MSRDEPPAPWDTSGGLHGPPTTILHYNGLIWESTNQLIPSVHTDLRLHLEMPKPVGRGDWDCPTLCTKPGSCPLTSHCPQTTNDLSLEPPRTALFHMKTIKVATPAVLMWGTLLRKSRRARKSLSEISRTLSYL